MGSSTPAPPAAPNPYSTASAQTGENIDTALANSQLSHVNQVDQFGDSSVYAQDGSTPFTDPTSGTTYQIPDFTQTTTLSPQNEAIYNTDQQIQQEQANIGLQQVGNVGNDLAQGVSLDPYNTTGPGVSMASVNAPPSLNGLPSAPSLMGLPNLPGEESLPNAPNLINADSSAINNYVNSQWEQPFSTQWGQNQEQENQTLADQGIDPGSQAYGVAQNEFGQEEQNAQDTYASNMYGTAGNILEGQNAAMTNLYGDEASATNAYNANLTNLYGDQTSAINNANATRVGDYSAVAGATNAANSNTIGEWADYNAANLAATGQNDAALQTNWVNQNNAVGMQNAANVTKQETPINEIDALLGASQVAPATFASTPSTSIPTTDYAQISQNTYQDQLAAYNAQLANQSATQGGLFGLGGALLGGLGRIGAAAVA